MQQQGGIKDAIFGPAKIGKTSLLWTLPPESTLFVDLEAGCLCRAGGVILWRFGTGRPLAGYVRPIRRNIPAWSRKTVWCWISDVHCSRTTIWKAKCRWRIVRSSARNAVQKFRLASWNAPFAGVFFGRRKLFSIPQRPQASSLNRVSRSVLCVWNELTSLILLHFAGTTCSAPGR